jgi:Tfp pilus assembly protein PilE
MRKQKGFTFWGLAFTLAIIAIVALLTMKLFPAYSEFFAVKRAMNRLQTEGSLSSMSKRDITRAFQRSSGIDDIRSIKASDLEISKARTGETVVSVDYEVVVPLVANVSALLTFHASTDDSVELTETVE